MRSGDPCLIPRRVPRDPRALHVQRVHLLRQAEGAELHAVRAEGVRLEDVRAVPQVHLMDVCDEIRLGQIQLVERSIQEDALRVEHRPHRAVAHEDAVVEFVEEGSAGHGGG